MHQLSPLKKKIKSKLIGREKGHNSEREQRLAKALLKRYSIRKVFSKPIEELALFI